MNDPEYRIGDHVMYDGSEHRALPQYYPKAGTEGVVTGVGNIGVMVRWLSGSTSKRDVWWAPKAAVFKVNLLEGDT